MMVNALFPFYVVFFHSFAQTDERECVFFFPCKSFEC